MTSKTETWNKIKTEWPELAEFMRDMKKTFGPLTLEDLKWNEKKNETE